MNIRRNQTSEAVQTRAVYAGKTVRVNGTGRVLVRDPVIPA